MSTWPTFTCTYRIGEREFTFHLQANDWSDAERHIKAIKRTAKLDGEVVLTGYLPSSFAQGGRQ